MSWKKILDDACRSYDDKDLVSAKRKAEMAMREAATLGGEEGAKAVEEIHQWLKILEQKIGSGTNRKEESQGDTRKATSKPTGNPSQSNGTQATVKPTVQTTTSVNSSNKGASDVMQGLCGLAAGVTGWWFATQGALKSVIGNLHFAHQERVSKPYTLDSGYSSGDSLIDLVNWLIGTAAVIAVVWTSGWIGAGIGRFLAFLGSASMEGLEELANKEEQRLQGQSSPPQRSNVAGSDAAKGGPTLGDIIAEFFRSKPSRANEAEEARRRQDAANLQRFYPGVPLEDAWERSQLSLKGNFIVGTKQWRTDALDAREKTYIIVYQDQITATCTNMGGSLTDKDMSVALNQTGQLHFQEMTNGTMITFRWLPPAFERDDLQLFVQDGQIGNWVTARSWVESRCSAARNTAYMFIDSYLVPPKLGGQTD